jgi:peptidoglycan L-alanyl-D-glutamate endopeptidase CwlK
MSRSLADLEPKVAQLCQKFIDKCKQQDIDILITCTKRTDAEQAALYAQGRTIPGKIITNARPGQSFHAYGVAFDFCPIVNGKCQWNDIKLFTRCGEIAESAGLEWSGRWTGKFKETAHCQLTEGHTLKDFQAGIKPDALKDFLSNLKID